MPRHRVSVRDSTLREGLDVPWINFSLPQKLTIVACLKRLGIKEIEIGQPHRIAEACLLCEKIKKIDHSLITSGLIFGFGNVREELLKAKFLDRIDILMPLVERGPQTHQGKIDSLQASLKEAQAFSYENIGVGFPHATSADFKFLTSISKVAVLNGAKRIILYDTNGKASPAEIYKIVKTLVKISPIHIHCHNDRGLALGNALAAIQAGARFVDATFHGIGDRAGNTAIEPLLVNLELEGIRHNTNLNYLKEASDRVAKITGLRNPLFPVTGDFSFYHSTRTHLEKPEIFEAFSPDLIGAKRKLSSTFDVNPGKANILKEIMRRRRSIRAFEPTKIKKSVLRSIIQSALLAPSAMNGQPWHFIVIEDKKVIERIARIKNNRCPPAKNIYTADFLLKAPLLIVVCVDKTKSFDRGIENAVLAASHIMLTAAAYGLGTTYLSAFRWDEPLLEQDMRALLRLPQNIMPVTILPLGFPAENPKKKKAVDIRSRMHRDFFIPR